VKIQILCVGKTNHTALRLWIPEYLKRLSHYIRIEWIELQEVKNTKNLRKEDQKKAEGKQLLNHIQPSDVIVLFDEKGKEYDSESFAGFIQKKMNAGTKNLIFIIGGAYGFSEAIHQRAQHKISLSRMTFSHQMVRVFVTEQLYRAFTILNNEPYHHA